MSNNLSAGRVKQFHLAVESQFGDGVTQSSSTLIEALSGSVVEFQKQELHDSEAVNDSRDPGDPIYGRSGEIPFTIESYALTQPSAGVASSLETIIMAVMGATSARVTPAGQTCLAGSTKSVIKVTDASSHQLFDGVRIEGQTAFVSKVDTGANELTVAPPLLTVPTVGAAVGKTRTIHLADDQPTIGLDAKYDWMTLRGAGGVVKSLSFDSSGKDPVKVKLTGSLSSQVITGRAVLSANVAGSAVATFDIDNPHAFEVGSKFDINGETSIAVLAVDTVNKQITVTRGTSPSAHTSGDVCSPSWTGGTVTGSPAHGRSGRALRGDDNGDAVSIPAVSRSFVLDTGSGLINDEDGASEPTYAVGGARKVTGSRTLHLRELDLKWLRSGKNEDYQPEVYEMSANDRGMAIFMPRVSLAVPSLSEGTSRDISQDFSAGFAKDADGNDVANKVVVIATW